LSNIFLFLLHCAHNARAKLIWIVHSLEKENIKNNRKIKVSLHNLSISEGYENTTWANINVYVKWRLMMIKAHVISRSKWSQGSCSNLGCTYTENEFKLNYCIHFISSTQLGCSNPNCVYENKNKLWCILISFWTISATN
jgi:hypothetical protein